ncbi:trypsin-like serine peptidase [Microbaculum marinum]|uniref:Serine protease n=1 Tax=Microbaculum marinum TaxID=1764581 RepID=A0AAW9RT97_9HYPH
MTIALRLASALSALALSTCILGSGAALAQQAARTSSSPERPAGESSLPLPKGPQQSKMPLVSSDLFEEAAELATGGRIRGKPGVSGASVGANAESDAANLSEPEAFGSSTAPYTTARVAVGALGSSTTNAKTPVTSYPYRATGKLWARWGDSWYVCTASLVKKGVLITAAHCIFNYGDRAEGWADEVRWYPANYAQNGAPYGYYSHRQLRVPTSYYAGTDTCTQAGVVCNNDIATVVLNTRDGQYPGNVVGWYAYGWNGYSFKKSSFLGNKTTVQITQLGYPLAFDSGYQMIRTDAVGWYYSSGSLKNTQIGSAQTGGSSGGPWLTNFGTKPSVSSAASLGNKTSQAVVGVTSYGSTTKGYNRQGASYFGQNKEFSGSDYGGYGAGNIGKIMQDTCAAQPSYC